MFHPDPIVDPIVFAHAVWSRSTPPSPVPEFAAKTAAPGDDDATGGGGCSGYFCFINRAREAVGSTALVIPGTGWMSLPPKWYLPPPPLHPPPSMWKARECRLRYKYVVVCLEYVLGLGNHLILAYGIVQRECL